jgi:hypothetical protein
MHKGGDLGADATFKKILSIGYEFECSDLAKLSLHTNKKTFINSDLALRTLKRLVDRKSIKYVDDPHYLHVRIPIHKKNKKIQEMTEEEQEEEEDEFLKELKEEFPEEYEEEQKQIELAKKENESYLEYFFENRKTDNKETIKFFVTNDLADTVFNKMLKEKCKGLALPKNDMYFFRTNHGKLYDIKFSEEIATNEVCDSFSSVEFVVTYYSPKREFANVIMDTFVDACSRILDHMGDLKKIKGELLLQDEKKTHYVPAAPLGKDRCLYHKPGTNLFYMDTYDDEDLDSLQSLGDAAMVPQMTFRSKAQDSLAIMKEILKMHGKAKKGKSVVKDMIYEMNTLEFVEKPIDDLLEEHNKSHPENQILLNTDIGNTVKLYLFLIFYKLHMFITNRVSIFTKEGYLKDFLTFSSRHSNGVLYERVKELLSQHYGLKTSDQVYQFLNQPKILENFYEVEEGTQDEEEDFDEDGNYKYNYDAHSTDLPEDDPNFGNPLFSMISYFKYLETKESDWLKDEKYDVFSTSFDLKSDEVLLENRYFMYEINFFLKNNTNSKFAARDLTFHNLRSIVNHFYTSKMESMITLTRNPRNQRITQRSKLEASRKKKTIAKVGPTSKYRTVKSRSRNTLRNREPGLSVIVEGEE